MTKKETLLKEWEDLTGKNFAEGKEPTIAKLEEIIADKKSEPLTDNVDTIDVELQKNPLVGFETALSLLKFGKKVSRKTWEKNNLFVVIKPSGVMALGNATSMSPVELTSAALLAEDWFEVE